MPGIYKYIILIVTPLLLGWVLVSSIPDWVDKIKDADTNNKEWFAKEFKAESFESTGEKSGKVVEAKPDYLKISFDSQKKVFDKETKQVKVVDFVDYKEYNFDTAKSQQTIVKVGDIVKPNDVIATGEFVNNAFYKFLGRILLLTLFIFISFVVYLAYKRRVKEGRVTA